MEVVVLDDRGGQFVLKSIDLDCRSLIGRRIRTMGIHHTKAIGGKIRRSIEASPIDEDTFTRLHVFQPNRAPLDEVLDVPNAGDCSEKKHANDDERNYKPLRHSPIIAEEAFSFFAGKPLAGAGGFCVAGVKSRVERMGAHKTVDPEKVRIGDVVLVASRNHATEWVQKRLGFGESSKWTHVAGSLGGLDLIEGQVPRSRVASLQSDYVEKGFEIKVLRKLWDTDRDRVKVTLWWATMNNLRYDFLQLIWFGMACVVGELLLMTRNEFNARGRKICSELIADGFYKEGYNLFSRRAENILPADYDNHELFDEVLDIWL